MLSFSKKATEDISELKDRERAKCAVPIVLGAKGQLEQATTREEIASIVEDARFRLHHLYFVQRGKEYSMEDWYRLTGALDELFLQRMEQAGGQTHTVHLSAETRAALDQLSDKKTAEQALRILGTIQGALAAADTPEQAKAIARNGESLLYRVYNVLPGTYENTDWTHVADAMNELYRRREEQLRAE